MSRYTCLLVVALGAGVAQADVQSHEDLASFLADPDMTFGPTLENFEGFGSGTTITSLPASGISAVVGTDRTGVAVDVNVTAEADLPFGMFTPGTLPSGANFLSNDLASPFFATGTIEFVFGTASQAVGFYVADGAPLDTFNITIYGASGLIGSFSSAAPKTLPDSFFGVVSDVLITRAVIGSNTSTDSWGIDDLYTAIPAPASLSVLALAGLMGRRRR